MLHLYKIRCLLQFGTVQSALLITKIKDTRRELEIVKEKENENSQYIKSSFMLDLSNILIQGKMKIP